jgi:hypothetical protein
MSQEKGRNKRRQFQAFCDRLSSRFHLVFVQSGSKCGSTKINPVGCPMGRGWPRLGLCFGFREQVHARPPYDTQACPGVENPPPFFRERPGREV